MGYDTSSFEKVIINKVDGSILSYNNVKVIASGNYLLIREETANNLSYNTVISLGDIMTFTTK